MAVYIRERSPGSRGRFILRWGLVGLAGLLLIGGAVWVLRGLRQRSEGTSIATLAPLPQDPLIQVFFNQSQAAYYTEPYRVVERSGDDLEQVIIAAIRSADVSVDVAVQELRLPGIAAALRERHQAGVRVRVILENTYRRPLSAITPQEIAAMEERDRLRYADSVQIIDRNQDGQQSPEEIAENDALVVLQNAGIPILDDRADGSAGSGLMHHKFVVVDDRLVILGSANFTASDIHGDFLRPDSRGNANHLLRISSPAVAQVFTQEFALMWGDG
ncbi:phospholipase D-like domain-containing protein, partial [Vacuolonema iberomarrocanum]|uniref:phospholipase D-like domain-containing protein n=1 Tax=Vacuolonema iberomarrocanum TaxID=3454632 RepID=UPI001A08301A|nr:competence protein ComE [filamentous cyanobacterium LEGE 07170]